jgi:tetratricopeptide (TPR) repeat protein
MLHLELHSRYATEGAAAHLVEATRARVRSLAQVYAEEARSQMAPSLAARSLVGLAESLETAGRLVSALVVLKEALTIDPTNPEAILGLAYQYEHHRLQQDATAMLKRLLELEPRSDEGRLRMAMGLLREQRSREAEELLDAVIADGRSEWVLAVAHEELARLLLREKRLGEAIRVLRSGVVRLPENQRLYLELAYALDLSGQRAAGREVVARLPRASSEPSPRLRYRVRPRGGEGGRHAELVRHGMARLPQLAIALSRIGGSG